MIKLDTVYKLNIYGKMISIIITSFKEEKTIGKAIESFIIQNIKEDYELIVSAPDEETIDVVKKYQKKNKKIKLFKDPGKGKSYALNLLLPKIRGRIIILSDGDVFVSDNSVNEILKHFEDKKVGCVSGRPVSQDDKKKLFGYWSHLLCHSAHKMRLKRQKKQSFLECSGYLWAFRKGVIKKFPTDIAEDTIVPIFFWLKGYKIKYSPKALVFVSFPKNLRDFIKQKRRAAASHETIFKYTTKKIPRMKSLKNEIIESYIPFLYPQTLKELIYTITLYPIRLYIWLNLFYNQKFRKRFYKDAWKRVQSTK